MPKFYLQTRIRFDFFDNLVVSSHHIADRHTTPFCSELAQLVEIKSNKLFNFEYVDALAQTGILGQYLGSRQTASCRDNDWSVAIIDIVTTTANNSFARGSGYMNSHVPDKEIPSAP
ncbi:hypothetical protein WI23_00850 [Burkholderia oklahomensis C6786]|nr:hypothetical protein WI23_00850 [Burkholderia oklahomensis C6786]KUY61513.1 hypothetical protein WI23_09980 [Burkholderia oklahomensis C6786]